MLNRKVKFRESFRPRELLLSLAPLSQEDSLVDLTLQYRNIGEQQIRAVAAAIRQVVE